mgnify:CR=1 FL=1
MADQKGQVIAIGGGGFGRSIYNTKIDQYIINQCETKNPKVCFIPTASAEDKAYTVNFYAVYSKRSCNPTHINFFQRTPKLDSIINKQDIIFVGGGNTKSMLAVWKEWKLDKLLLKAYNRGAILCGVSAGAICWFKQGITDSWASNLNVMDCLDFIPECCCPHYDGEADRRPSVHSMIESGKISSCLAVEDGAAIHYKDNKLLTSVSFYKNKKSYIVKKTESGIIEEEIGCIQL